MSWMLASSSSFGTPRSTKLLSQAAALAPTAIADKTPKLALPSTRTVAEANAVESALSSSKPEAPTSSPRLAGPTSAQAPREIAARIVEQTAAARNGFMADPLCCGEIRGSPRADLLAGPRRLRATHEATPSHD